MKKSLNFLSVILAIVCMFSIMACSGGDGPKPTPPCTENCGPVVNDGSTMEKAIPVVIGTVQTRVKKDEAYYSVTLMSGESYKFLIGAPAVTTLFDPEGNSLATSSDYEDGIIIWDCSSGGKYYFLVEPDNINRDYQILVIIADDPIMDSDEDNVIDSEDSCPGTPANESVDANGCSDSQKDSDGDGIVDSDDEYPNCDDRIDSDGDGIPDCEDQCPTNPSKVEPGTCGCDVSDVDTDGDGLSDCIDLVNNDGLSIEAAIELVSNNWVWRQTGIKKYFKFHGVEGKYYDFNVQVEGGINENSKRITIFNMAGKYLAFKPGVVDPSLRIDNWPCSENGVYIVIVESSLEEAGDIFSIHMQETDYWLGTAEYLMGAREGDGRDQYEFDDKYWHGRTIAIDEVQNRTSLYQEGYDFDWVFALVEQGKTYEFRVSNTLNADMSFLLQGPDGGDALIYTPHVTSNFIWTAPFTDFILMRLVSWNSGIYGEYSFQIVEVTQ